MRCVLEFRSDGEWAMKPIEVKGGGGREGGVGGGREGGGRRGGDGRNGREVEGRQVGKKRWRKGQKDMSQFRSQA